jgi:rubrerythrin
MLRDYQQRIIDSLAELEEEISRLYRLFAARFPTHAEMWSGMAEEEMRHVGYVRELLHHINDKKALFDEMTTKTYTIKTFLDNVREKQEKTEKNEYSVLNALSISHDLEQSLIERRFYEYFQSDDQTVKRLLKQLREETYQHLTRVRTAWEEEKAKSS